MKVKNKSPRTEMTHAALINKMTTIYEDLGETLGYGKEAVDAELSRFATLSARIEFDKGEVDFSLALPVDTSEQIREKFLAYVDTEKYRLVEEALIKVLQADLPLTPPEQVPLLAEDAPKKS